SGSAGTRTRNQAIKRSRLLSEPIEESQQEHCRLRILLTFESYLELPRFGNRRQFPCCNGFEPTSEPMRRMIAAAVMFCDSAVKVFSGADIMSTGGATQNINPSHLTIGSAGTRTRNQRLKRALLYRLSYRPARRESF